MADSNGRLALVTGGSFGLGLAMAGHLRANGFEVLVCARSKERLEKAAEELPGLRTLPVDITCALPSPRALSATGTNKNTGRLSRTTYGPWGVSGPG